MLAWTGPAKFLHFLCIRTSSMFAPALFVLLALLSAVNAFAPRSLVRTSLALKDAATESKLTAKLSEKKEVKQEVKKEVKKEAKKETPAATKKVGKVSSYTPVVKQIKEPAYTKKFAEVIPPTPKTPPKPEESRQFKIEFPTISLPKFEFESKVAVSPSVPSVPGANDALVGISLGLVPFVLIPVALLNVAQGLIKKPKPTVAAPSGKKVIRTFNKPLDVGAKEGIEELLSGKVTEDLELTRKGIKLSLAGFSSAAAGVALLLALGGSKPEATVVEKKPVPDPVVKVAPVKAPEPVVVKPAPEPVKAPEPVVVKPVKPVKQAPKVEEYKAPVPKGMEPEQVDLEKLKSLRKVKKN